MQIRSLNPSFIGSFKLTNEIKYDKAPELQRMIQNGAGVVVNRCTIPEVDLGSGQPVVDVNDNSASVEVARWLVLNNIGFTYAPPARTKTVIVQQHVPDHSDPLDALS